MKTIPISGHRQLRKLARRTTLVRIALGGIVVGLVVAALLAARHPRTAAPTDLPVRSGDLIVLDLSASVSQETFARIGETLEKLSASGGRYGLVIFSSVAYEALPPGTPATALRPLVRYFTLPAQENSGGALSFPRNPWSASFSGGTAISAGLELARSLIEKQRLDHASVVLVSDLADDPEDRNRLNSALTSYRREGIPLRVVPLNASVTDREYFARLTSTALSGDSAPSATSTSPGRRAEAAPNGFPRALVLWILAAAVALGAVELWSARLRWGAT